MVGDGSARAPVPVRIGVPALGVDPPPVDEHRIAIAWHRDRALSPAARAFIALAQELCAELAETVIPEAVGG